MNSFLVRVGVDSSYGGWNAPVDPRSGSFVYVPVPENDNTEMRKGLAQSFSTIYPQVEAFFQGYSSAFNELSKFKNQLNGKVMHLDPDFKYLSYGDREFTEGSGGMTKKVRGLGLLKVRPGDILAFYAGLRSVIAPYDLVYALIGIITVKKMIYADAVSSSQWDENAHTRRVPKHKDFIFFGETKTSGRLSKCIPIGGWESKAYRVDKVIHEAWGGLMVKDRFIQRGSPFQLSNPGRFQDWLHRQGIPLLQTNNP